MPTEVIPTTHHHDDLHPPGRTPEQEAYLDALCRRHGDTPVHDVESMARPHLFDEDDTFPEFLDWLRKLRGRDLA